MKRAIGALFAMILASGAHATDSVYFHKDTVEAAEYRGGIVYNNYCILCHGVKADGNGRAAKIYNPKPADLVNSDKNDEYKHLIIRNGGAALGRSKFMPPWREELTEEQLNDVVTYLRAIQTPKP